MSKRVRLTPLRFGVMLRHPKYDDVLWMVVAPNPDPTFPWLAIKVNCRTGSFSDRPGSHEIGKIWRIPEKGWVLVD